MAFLSKDHIAMPATSNEFTDLFKVNIYGEDGSELARSEKTAFFYFKTWLKSVFRGAQTISVVTDLYTDSMKAVTVKMADVLQFFTGASSLPPCGFRSKISIHFDPNAVKGHVSICALNAIVSLNRTISADLLPSFILRGFLNNGFGRKWTFDEYYA